jgi:F-type H+-transporting ATPase subunit a
MFAYINVLKLSITAFFLLFLTNAKAADAEDPTAIVMHHIGDAHQFHIFGDIYLPLPCIAYSKDGLFFSLSSAFEYDHETHMSKNAINGYVIYHDVLKRLVDEEGNSPSGNVDLTAGHDAHEGHDHGHEGHDHKGQGHDKAKNNHAAHGETVVIGDKHYKLVSGSALQELTSWYDFSITKNVFAMFLATFLLIIIFGMVSSAYKKRSGKAPKGMQSFFEVIIVFMRDEVIKPAIGHKWEKYFPYLMTVFFFILFANLLGLIPFFPGSANITGNLGVTMVLAIITFLITNFSGNGHYWRHVFAMPGVPWPILLILTPIEIIGLFIKPITLMIRLFANITAGHIIILSLVSLIFVFGKGGESMSGAIGGGAIAVPFVFAMNFLELFVAFLQAFIFTLLSSLSIGAAVEEHHHEDHETAHH